MISSPEIDKYLRRYLSPILRESGFAKVSARKAWGWEGQCVRVLQVRAVGNYFSQVTGWPPMSVCVWTGVYYDFIPFQGHTAPKVDNKGRMIPNEACCHLRSHLTRTLDQSMHTNSLSNPAERVRKDIWWFEPDGSNLEKTVENIALCFVDEGKPWFKKYTELEAAFAEIEAEPDCYIKYYRAQHFAKQLGLNQKYEKYSELTKKERERIQGVVA